MSVHDFLVPVLQSSDISDLNVFFQILFSLIRIVCRGIVILLLWESLRSTVFFLQVLESFRYEALNGFPVGSMFPEVLSFLHFVAGVCSESSKIANNILFYFSASSEQRVTNTPLKQRQPRSNCFVNKKNESLQLLSLSFCCLAGSANKDCVKSIARTL